MLLEFGGELGEFGGEEFGCFEGLGSLPVDC